MNRKKNYQTPSMRVVELHSQVSILQNSGGGGPAQARRFDYDTFDYGE